jgi:hypothetical protein
MKNRFLLTLILLTSFKLSFSQSPCGSIFPPEMNTWLNDFIDHSEKYPYAANTRSYSFIPIKFHLVGTSQGTGYYNMKYLWPVICELNEKYAPVGFYFYIYGKIDYINNDSYYNQDLNAGFDMMYNYSTEGVVNVFVVHDAAGYCGYYAWGPDAISIATNCMNPGSTTLAHELGHYFSLPHPFDNVNGTPEYVDESNCTSGGDLFCDTRADFLDYRWNCPYLGSQTDAHGDPYDPDETLFMSYSYDACQNRFSDEQISAMVNYLMVDRSYLLNQTIPSNAAIVDTVQKITPENGSANVYNDWVEFTWDPVSNATFYQLQVTKYQSFYAPLTVNQLVYGTAFTTSLLPDLTYYWRIQPLSEGYTCTQFSQPDTFSTILGTGIAQTSVASQLFKGFPTLVNGSEPFNVFFLSEINTSSQLRVVDINGKVVKLMSVEVIKGANNWKIKTSDLAAGMYVVTLSSNGSLYQQKMVLNGK